MARCQHQDMMARCQQMMQMRQKMATDMPAMDQKLDRLVAQMNTAQGQAKVDAMAAVLNELISQRKQMREEMMAGVMGTVRPSSNPTM